MKGLMLYDTPCQPEWTLRVDGVWVEFSLAQEGIQVNIHTFHAMVGSHKCSWETTVTSHWTPGISVVKETSLLTSSPSIQRQTPFQGSKK